MGNRSHESEDQELVQVLQVETGIEIDEVVRITDNRVFKELLESVDGYFKRFKLFRYMRMEMNSIVGVGDRNILKIHNSISFHFPDNSMIRFSPLGQDELEITRIVVHPNHQGIGIGSKLMELLFDFLQEVLGQIPTIQLECNGGVGFGDNQRETPISEQISFFQGFDFKIIQGSLIENYVRMERKIKNDLAV